MISPSLILVAVFVAKMSILLPNAPPINYTSKDTFPTLEACQKFNAEQRPVIVQNAAAQGLVEGQDYELALSCAPKPAGEESF